MLTYINALVSPSFLQFLQTDLPHFTLLRTMRSTALLAALAIIAAPVLADTLAYDTHYDDRAGSLTSVACSDGEHGLITTKHYHTYGDIPNFPNIGAVFAVEGWNSVNCGTCWEVTYTDGAGAQHKQNITAIDHAGAGSFNVALASMNKLTNGNAVQFGRVTVTSRQVPASGCGL